MVTIRSEREIHSHFARRVFPWMIPLYPLLYALHVIINPWLLDGIYFWTTHIGVLFQYLFYMLLLGHFLFGWFFSLNNVEYDNNSLTLRRERNYWNRMNWLLSIPFSEIARIRLNGDQYDVIRTDGSIVPLPKGEDNIVAYHRVGRSLVAFLEAETEVEVPFQLPGSSPPPEPGIDYMKNAELRKNLEKQETSLDNLFAPGILLVFFLILYGGVMSGDLIYNQNVDGENLSCFGILFVLFVIVIVLARQRWDVAQITKTALGPEQHEEYHRDHMILVSRPVEPGQPIPPIPVPMGLMALAGPIGPRKHHAPGRWKGIPYNDSTTQMEGVLRILYGMLILPILITGAALFFQIVRLVDHLMNDSSGIGGLLESALLPFTLGLFVFLVLLIALKFHLGLKLLLPRMNIDNPIEQAIEDRYWGLANDHHGEGKGDSEISEERIDQVAGETEEGTTEKEVDGNDQEN